MKLKLEFVPESRQAYKLWSIQLAVVSAALGAFEATLPLWENEIPGGVFAGLSSLTAIMAAVVRVLRQGDIR